MTVESSILFVALGKQNRANNLEKKKKAGKLKGR